MRVPMLAANWKMHNTAKESVDLINGVVELTKGVFDRDIVICPPFTSLYEAKKALIGKTPKLGAQDMFWEEKGAYTGEISPIMLLDAGCEFVIIGHSERRGYFNETDEMVNKKLKSALAHGLKPIVCVGESLQIRENGRTQEFVAEQIRKGFDSLSGYKTENIIVAYEPIWAIGTGKNDTPNEPNATCKMIRGLLSGMLGSNIADNTRILYGGSVKPENIDGFMKENDIDGALVGGASLKADSFARIVKYQ